MRDLESRSEEEDAGKVIRMTSHFGGSIVVEISKSMRLFAEYHKVGGDVGDCLLW